MFCRSGVGEFTLTSEDIQTDQIVPLPPTLRRKTLLVLCALLALLRLLQNLHMRVYLPLEILLCA